MFKFKPTKKLLIYSTTTAILTVTLIYLFLPNKVIPSQNQILGDKTSPGYIRAKGPHEILLNDTFTLAFNIDTNGQPANAASLYVKFDPEKLKILRMDTTQSFCQFYPENKYDNQVGAIKLSCGAPSPGVTGTNTLMTVTFFSQNIGKTTISIDPEKSQLLLNDGKGTDILTKPINHDLLILNTP